MGTLAIAQTLIILTAGIDLSVGAVMILSSMVWPNSPSATACQGLSRYWPVWSSDSLPEP